VANRLDDPESLAARLDVVLPAGRSPLTEEDDSPLVDMALHIASASHPVMSAEMSAHVRSRMLTQHGLQFRRHTSFLRPVLRWGANVCAVALLCIIGLTPFVLASVPGDRLYPYKQVVEWSELATSSSHEQRVFTHLLHAQRRAQEAVALTQRGLPSSSTLAASFVEMSILVDLLRETDNLSPSALQHLSERTQVLAQTLRTLAAPANPEIQATLSSLETQLWQPTPHRTPASVTQTATLEPSATSTPMPTEQAIATPTPSPSSASDPGQTNPEASLPDAQTEEAWDENAPCSNPPPTWAPAAGWRARCEGGQFPEDDESEEDTGPPPFAGQGS